MGKKRSGEKIAYLRKRVGKRIKCLRLAADESQAVVGAAVGTTDSAIAHYEVGKHLPTLDVAIALAQHFGVTLDYLYDTTDAYFAAQLRELERLYRLDTATRGLPDSIIDDLVGLGKHIQMFHSRSCETVVED
jgi:DNA-binding XRE family transcriptional regulator